MFNTYAAHYCLPFHHTGSCSLSTRIRMRIFASHQCADYVCASYAGAGEARVACFTFAIVSRSQTLTRKAGESGYTRLCLLQEKLFKYKYPSCNGPAAPSSLTSISIVCNQLHLSESSISGCVRLCDAQYDLYPMALGRAHVLCENGSSIQSLTLMCSAIITSLWNQLPQNVSMLQWGVV